MANRSYLYSTNHIPGSAAIDDRRAVGIAEWSYDIPIVFKLLLSGDTRTCASLIFEGNDEIALVGPYEKGVANMLRFLDRVPHPAVTELKAEAQEFLAAEENKNPYFVLEGGEVFGMVSESLPEENRKLLAELTDLEPQMQKAIANIEARIREETHPPGLFARLFGGRTPVRREDSSDLVLGLGLGGWNNVLFFGPKLG
jgi:hypothetical protein